jgi:hypothetical protein
VDTLAVISTDGAVDNKAIGSVLGVDVVVAVFELDGGLARTLVDLVVLAAVGGSTNSTSDSITGLPVGREVGAGAVVDTLGLLSVLRLARLLVGTDGTALGTIVLLLREVLGVGRAPNIETVTVISRDNDEGLIEDVKFLELLNSSANSVVELEKVTKSTIVVESVHLLVDRGSLGHEEETLILTTSAKDINGLEGHVLKTGQVSSISLLASGVIIETLEIVSEDIAVEPDRKVALAEDTESTLALVGLEERGLVMGNSVTLLLELLVVILTLVGALSSNEVLGTTAEENIGTLVLGPAVIAVSVKSLVDQRTVLASKTGVASESNGGSVGKVSGRNSTPGTALVKLE